MINRFLRSKIIHQAEKMFKISAAIYVALKGNLKNRAETVDWLCYLIEPTIFNGLKKYKTRKFVSYLFSFGVQ